SPDKVRFHLPLMGGAFGRRFSSEYIAEAIAISKQIGSPVQVLWTRDDDLRHDFYRPMTYHAMKGAVNGSSIVAYYHQCLRAGGGGRGGANWGRGQVGYGIANTGSMNGGVPSVVPTGPWRSVDATFMGYVTECFFDELCAAAKLDPYQARMDLLQNGTLKECVRVAAEKAGWGKPLPSGWGRGIACYSSFGSSVAHVAEVEVKNGVPKVHRIVSAVDCGLVVNPLGARAQIEGAVVDGIATMFYSQITIDGGGVYEQTFGEFGWARMPDAPVIETHFVERPDASPSGLGEPGFPPAGPAIANAIFAACGKRVRKLPIGGKIA
ncbi:MAG: xanthine dehydrogenase family protein molybdopterin-binding subunit, partial [Armatimonadetes bacterium]|nr:xanthine dehydrogenase family protein molybdopterin-binding subunit [Armatimonadota bacterium]